MPTDNSFTQATEKMISMKLMDLRHTLERTVKTGETLRVLAPKIIQFK